MGFSIDEWESLPWWQQRVYIDGLIRDEFLSVGESAGEDVTMAESRVAVAPNTTQLDSFSTLGFSTEAVDLEMGAE